MKSNQKNIPIPYLDNYKTIIPIVEGEYDEEDKNNDQIERCLRQIAKCGKEIMTDGRIITRRCKKMFCPKCGGYGKRNHKRASKAIMKRVKSIDDKFIRYMTFTMPMNLRPYFETRDMLQRFFDIVQRIIKKEFGVLSRNKKKKKGIERIYSLDKAVVATLELFSGEQYVFNPHINVLVFDNFRRGINPKISKEQLSRIKSAFKKALQTLLKENIEQVVVYYDFCPKKNHDEMKRLVWYVTKPLNPNLLENIPANGEQHFRRIDFLLVDLKGFRFQRYWGQLSSSEYIKHSAELN